MKLCEELLVALEGECVYYGVPMKVRRGSKVTDPRRLFKLNGLWFEAKSEKSRKEITQAGWGQVPTSSRVIEIERVVSVDMVMSHDVGEVKLPRPAIVIPGFTDKGNITLDDAIVTAHRHLVFGNAAPVGDNLIWKPTALSDEKPWMETATGNALAVVEYEQKVRARRTVLEDQFAKVVIDIRKRERAAQQAAREAQNERDAAENPAWGSW